MSGCVCTCPNSHRELLLKAAEQDYSGSTKRDGSQLVCRGNDPPLSPSHSNTVVRRPSGRLHVAVVTGRGVWNASAPKSNTHTHTHASKGFYFSLIDQYFINVWVLLLLLLLLLLLAIMFRAFLSNISINLYLQVRMIRILEIYTS